MEYILVKLGIIGAGTIIESHLSAAFATGFLPVGICGNRDSVRAKKISEFYPKINFFSNVEDLIKTDLDAILIAVSGQSQIDLLVKIDHLRLPTLIEKPVFNSANVQDPINLMNIDNIIVGYNRRHYSSVQKFKQTMAEFGRGYIDFNVPELSWVKEFNKLEIKTQTYTNAIHMIDLLNYLVPKKVITYVDFDEKTQDSTQFAFRSDNFSGNFNLTFGSPDLYSVKFRAPGVCAVLSPIEMYQEFNSIQINQQNQFSTYKTYERIPTEPTWKITEDDLSFKPGFLNQYREFARMVRQEEFEATSATLYDDQNAVRIAKSIFS
jgi:predicted dehydrogenase